MVNFEIPEDTSSCHTVVECWRQSSQPPWQNNRQPYYSHEEGVAAPNVRHTRTVATTS